MRTINIPKASIFEKKMRDLYARPDVIAVAIDDPWTDATVGVAAFDNDTHVLVEVYINSDRS